MSWIRHAWPFALFAIAAYPACTEEPNDDSTANTSNATAASTADDSSIELGCAAGAVGDTTDGATEPLMLTWGAPCSTDQDCIDILEDPDAICDFDAVVFELPGGYCTKECFPPDPTTLYVPDDPQCDPDGGVACQGVMGTHARCGPICTDDAQCNRDGYICRNLPLIGAEDDPRFCLMPDCCMDTCAE